MLRRLAIVAAICVQTAQSDAVDDRLHAMSIKQLRWLLRDLGALAEQLLTAPLTDADPNDPESESLHEMLGTLREAYTARRGDHSGLLGELAARRQGLEKRQRYEFILIIVRAIRVTDGMFCFIHRSRVCEFFGKQQLRETVEAFRV